MNVKKGMNFHCRGWYLRQTSRQTQLWDSLMMFCQWGLDNFPNSVQSPSGGDAPDNEIID